MQSMWYQELHLLQYVARWWDVTALSHIAQGVDLLGPGFGFISPAYIRSIMVKTTGRFVSDVRNCWYVIVFQPATILESAGKYL